MTKFEEDFRKEFCCDVDPAESICWKDQQNMDGVPCEMEVIAWIEEYFHLKDSLPASTL